MPTRERQRLFRTADIPEVIQAKFRGHAIISLYIGPGFAYNRVNAHWGNLKKRRKSMAAKKKVAKKLKAGKKMQPTKTLFTPVDGAR
jgi:hypothetical protein